ncbi:fos-related antigen 2-like [Limulus polyphemus]|uniref:Fos-related antigen 2-like n=1 Tax=Limulus polyphemus TaxID=6850 RepID=A0ABM1BKU8_LIMPO|nr:fos-related antigen 2-like [Limulus polyphemus]
MFIHCSNDSELEAESSLSDSQLTGPADISEVEEQNMVTTLNLCGLTSGIPTQTTHTPTPTTLKNLEESFLELQPVSPALLEHQNQAGFIPPVVSILDTSYQPVTIKQEPEFVVSRLTSSPDILCPTIVKYNGSKSTGGRKPNNDQLPPEEEERRKLRRERNKLAAARCRKRRLDHTNSLLKETEGLEEKRQTLQNEIQLLTLQKEELQFLLDAHKAACNLKKNSNKNVKPHEHKLLDSHSNHVFEYNNLEGLKTKNIQRPTSLPISSPFTNPAGISITTPSGGILNLDSWLECGTGLTPISSGLTPVISSCSEQQRSSKTDLSSPDTLCSVKLVSL